MSNQAINVDVILDLVNSEQIKAKLNSVVNNAQGFAKGLDAVTVSQNKAKKGSDQFANAVDNINKQLGKNGKVTINARNVYDEYNRVTGKVVDAHVKLRDKMGNVITYTENLSNTTKKAQGAWSGLGPGIDAVNKKLNSVRWTMVNVGFAMAAVIVPILAIGKSYIDLGMKINRVAAITKQSTSQVLSDVSNLQKGTIYSMSEIADSYTEFAKLGFSSQEVIKAMPSVIKLATVGFTDLNTAVSITGQTLYQFGIDVKYTESVVSIIAGAANATATDVETFGKALSYVGGIAAALGMGLEDTAAALGVLSNYGIKSSRMGTSMAAALTAMASPSVKAEMEMNKLGISFADANGNLKDLTTIIPELSKALDGMGSAAKADILTTIFSQRGERAVYDYIIEYERFGSVLDRTKDKMREMGNVTMINNLVMNDGAAKAKTFTQQMGALLDKFNQFAGKKLTADITQFSQMDMKLAIDDTEQYTSSLWRAANAVKAIREASISARGPMQEMFTAQVTEKYNELKKQYKEDKGFFGSLLPIDAGEKQKMFYKALQLVVEELNKLAPPLEKTPPLVDEFGDSLDTVNVKLAAQSDFEAKLSRTRDQTNKGLKIATDSLNYYKDKLNQVNDEISKMSSMRFAGQTDADKVIAQAERAAKIEELASYGIGDAQSFLADMVAKAGDGFDTIYTKINKVTNATKSSKDSYDAWQQTVQEFITDTIKSGNLLGSNVTNAINEYSTMLLSTSKFETPSNTSNADTISSLDAMKQAYEIVYGGMESDVKLAIQAHEDFKNGVSDSSEVTITKLKELWEKQDIYTEHVNDSQDAVNDWNKELAKIDKIAETFDLAVNGMALSVKDLGTEMTAVLATMQKLDLIEKRKNSATPYSLTVETALSTGNSDLMPKDMTAGQMLRKLREEQGLPVETPKESALSLGETTADYSSRFKTGATGESTDTAETIVTGITDNATNETTRNIIGVTSGINSQSILNNTGVVSGIDRQIVANGTNSNNVIAGINGQSSANASSIISGISSPLEPLLQGVDYLAGVTQIVDAINSIFGGGGGGGGGSGGGDSGGSDNSGSYIEPNYPSWIAPDDQPGSGIGISRPSFDDLFNPETIYGGLPNPAHVPDISSSWAAPDGQAGSGITIGNVTVNGVSGDATSFANTFVKEIRKQLKTS